MAQALCRRDPDVVSLEINAENVVMRRVLFARNDVCHFPAASRTSISGLWVSRGPVNRPVRAVVIGQTFVGGEPRAIGVDAFDLAQKIAGQAAVFLQEVVPVAAVVAAGAEVGRDPEDLVRHS